MNVLVIGAGGREHALCWRLSRDRSVDRVWAAPGNAGIAEVATVTPVPVDDSRAILELVEKESIDLTVIGPEAPLVSGLADELMARGHPVFGPTAAGARIEGSKAWARRLCEDHGIPVPLSGRFDRVGPAIEFLDSLEAPYVIKADGLAGGKGVVIAEDRSGAREALEDRLVRGAFGDAGRTVLVEQYLEGKEVSALALSDGKNLVPLPLAQDFKRAGDGDRGPNTGGMGSYSPPTFIDTETERMVTERVLAATVKALEAEGLAYRGVLYAGLMLTEDGPRVLEFNCRFGDPETQVILPRLGSDLGEALARCARGDLGGLRLAREENACVGVVLASKGYPGAVRTGLPVDGLADAARMEGVMVFHAATEMRQGRVITAGGRVLTVSALGPTVEEARTRAYEACARIHFEGMTYRRDIARSAAGRTVG